MTAFVIVKDANGDDLTTIGPFKTAEEAHGYCNARRSRNGLWFLETVTPKISPEDLDWTAGSNVYEVLEDKDL